jgi:hypothetical protein
MSTGNNHPTMADSQKCPTQQRSCGDSAHSLHRFVKRRPWTHEQETEEMLRNTSRPEIRACIECGENAPEHGLICDECRLDAMGD